MKSLVIFGVGELAQLAHFYFSRDSDYEVRGFSVDPPYLKEPTLFGLPVVPFADIATTFPPSTHEAFVALGYSRLNANRRERFKQLRSMGYSLATYVSSAAKVWPDLVIGANCLIMESNVIQPFVRIGDNVIIWAGNLVSHHVTIGDHSFVSSHVTISGGVTIGQSCFVGINSTIREHVRIADNCIIGARALILKDTEADSAYVEEPTPKLDIPASRLGGLL